VTAQLELRGVHLRHPGADRDAVRDAHLRVAAGEILCLVGPNGSGKSTTLAALARELRPRRGRVTLDGEDAWAIPRKAFARRVARLPQEPLCPEGLSVEELVRGGRHPHVGFLRPLARRDLDAVHEALAWMDLLDLRKRAVDTLSGGERRRAWLAMVLCQGASTLLLDEPTAGLDLRHRWEVLERLRRINRGRGTTIVIVLHDLGEAARLAQRVAVFARGRVYDAGEPARVLGRETLRDVFAVEAEPSAGGGPPRLDAIRPADPLRNL
jgi:iron complex transport system ATP-binding protein